MTMTSTSRPLQPAGSRLLVVLLMAVGAILGACSVAPPITEPDNTLDSRADGLISGVENTQRMLAVDIHATSVELRNTQIDLLFSDPNAQSAGVRPAIAFDTSGNKLDHCNNPDCLPSPDVTCEDGVCNGRIVLMVPPEFSTVDEVAWTLRATAFHTGTGSGATFDVTGSPVSLADLGLPSNFEVPGADVIFSRHESDVAPWQDAAIWKMTLSMTHDWSLSNPELFVEIEAIEPSADPIGIDPAVFDLEGNPIATSPRPYSPDAGGDTINDLFKTEGEGRMATTVYIVGPYESADLYSIVAGLVVIDPTGEPIPDGTIATALIEQIRERDLPFEMPE